MLPQYEVLDARPLRSPHLAIALIQNPHTPENGTSSVRAPGYLIRYEHHDRSTIRTGGKLTMPRHKRVNNGPLVWLQIGAGS